MLYGFGDCTKRAATNWSEFHVIAKDPASEEAGYNNPASITQML
jgi:hypothetical protein